MKTNLRPLTFGWAPMSWKNGRNRVKSGKTGYVAVCRYSGEQGDFTPGEREPSPGQPRLIG